MVINFGGSAVNLDVDSLFLWAVVGLVAGFLASHLAYGRGLGLVWDIVIGILGALFGGIVLAGMLHFSITIAGHPLISSIVMAFIGAAILLVILRLVTGGRGLRRRAF